MMTTIKQELKKINKLIQRDNRNNQTIDGFYQQALSIIGNHLQEFYNEYADDNGLTNTAFYVDDGFSGTNFNPSRLYSYD